MLAGLVHSALAKALGWALVHSLWEGALIALLVGLGFLLCRPASARTRYALACSGMLAMLVAFGVTLAILWPAPDTPVTIAVSGQFHKAPMAAANGIPAPPAEQPDRLPWIVPFWMAGVLIFYVRTAGSLLAAQRLRTKGTVAAPQEWQERLRKLGERLRVTRPVLLLESCLAETPVVMGFLRPAILIPAGLITGLAPNQLEAILLHELAHIRRHDYAVNVMQSLVEGLLFYHPAVWWLSGLVRAERENCCDDRVVAVRGDASAYAVALAALEERRSAGEPALAASGGNLMKRIRRLIEPELPRPVAAPVLAAVLLLAPIAVGLSAWQPPTPPLPTTGTARTTDAAPAPPRVIVDKEHNRVLILNAIPAPQTESQPQTALDAPDRKSSNGDVAYIITDAERAAFQLQAALGAPYRKWLDEDVVYIITAEERAAFNRLQTDAEREKFIEQFWLRRDPTPGTAANEFKEEHYRRIAYANEHFASTDIPGWKTDRGRIYIIYGPPDSIDDHRGGTDGTLPYQVWTYRFIEGMGQNVTLRFTDLNGKGWYVLAAGPNRAEIEWPQNSQILASLDRQIIEEEVALAGIRSNYSETHPIVRKAEARLEQLRATRAAFANPLER